MKKSIGLYGGTFDPIHFGHLNLAIELKEKKNLSEVWVIPANLSPFRREKSNVSAEHRFKMVERGVSEIPNFRVLDLEIRRAPPSYAIDTIKEILESNREGAAFFLMMGDDSSIDFSAWKEADEIVESLPLLIGARSDASLKKNLSTSKLQEAIEKGRVETSRMEISATFVRNRLKNKLYCGHLVPTKVLDYIYENQLYFTVDDRPSTRS